MVLLLVLIIPIREVPIVPMLEVLVPIAVGTMEEAVMEVVTVVVVILVDFNLSTVSNNSSYFDGGESGGDDW